MERPSANHAERSGVSRRPLCARLALLAVIVASPTVAQPIDVSDFDIVGEVTGCPAPSLCGDFGNSLTSAGDVNGDAVLDLLIAGPTVSGDEPDTGRVYLFHGPFDGRDMNARDADVTITGLEFGDLVGAVASGDVNGDGLSDVVIGARGPDIDGGILNGQVWVFYSPISGDLLVSDADAEITGMSFSELGRAIAVGDFNGDEISDVLAGAPATGNGAAHVFYGPIFGDLDSTDSDAVIDGVLAFEDLGSSVAAVDVDDDGIQDVVVGAPKFPLDELGDGRVVVFFGPLSGALQATDADVEIAGEELNDGFGAYVASGGDVNGDGVEDLLVGADQLFNDGPGRAYVFYGPLAPGVVLGADADAILLGEPVDGGDLFGTVAGPGDLNGDGFDEVLVGAQFAGEANRGRAYIFEGPLSGEIDAADAEWIFDAPGFDPDQGFDVLGRGVGVARDLDGNGFDDALLGAPGSDGPGFARVVMAPGLEAAADPQGSLVLPPEGGTIQFTLGVTNTSTAQRVTQAWFTIRRDGGSGSRLRGPFRLSLEPASRFERERTVRIPGRAPAGTYTVTVEAGRFPTGAASASFGFEKQPAP